MIARLVTTLVLFLLSLYAFSAGALDGGHVLNPSGIAFLILAGAVWFGWDAVRAALYRRTGRVEHPDHSARRNNHRRHEANAAAAPQQRRIG
jgi:hypothetical protein